MMTDANNIALKVGLACAGLLLGMTSVIAVMVGNLFLLGLSALMVVIVAIIALITE
jgi:hypothetical protein